MRTYARALAPGTYANRAKQAHCYITFAVLYNVPYLSPNTLHVCMFSQFLANKFDSVSSVKNYVSGARTWVLEHGGNPSAFSGYEHSMMIKAILKDSNHVPKRAFPLSIEHLLKISAYLDKARNVPLCIKPCILIGFSCYLRSSNLLAPQISVLGGPHTLLAKDIIDCGSSLKVQIVSTKTRRLPYTLYIPSCDQPQICPVRAWRRYNNHEAPHPNGPAFIVNRINSLTPALVVQLMRDALSDDKTLDVLQISMHSLRRGAAQQAEKNGCTHQDIMARGGWASSSGLKPYLSE